MAASASERFTDQKLTRSIDGNWTATRAWDVVGFTDEQSATTATGVTDGSAHPRNADLKCTHIGRADNKFTLSKVVATYEITNLLSNPTNPLSRAPIISWKWGKTQQPIDTDMLGNPILNSAGDAFKQHGTRNFSVRFLTITRCEPYYNQAAAQLYTDTVCNGAITFEGNTFGAGQVYCISYAPTKPYQKTVTYVEVAYNYEIRTPSTPNLTALQKRHPFQLRILDQGLRANYVENDLYIDLLGHLYLKGGEPVTRDVLFNGAGKPIDKGIKVTLDMNNASGQTLPTGVIKDVTAKAVFLIYPIYAETDFTAMGL